MRMLTIENFIQKVKINDEIKKRKKKQVYKQWKKKETHSLILYNNMEYIYFSQWQYMHLPHK